MGVLYAKVNDVWEEVPLVGVAGGGGGDVGWPIRTREPPAERVEINKLFPDIIYFGRGESGYAHDSSGDQTQDYYWTIGTDLGSNFRIHGPCYVLGGIEYESRWDYGPDWYFGDVVANHATYSADGSAYTDNWVDVAEDGTRAKGINDFPVDCRCDVGAEVRYGGAGVGAESTIDAASPDRPHIRAVMYASDDSSDLAKDERKLMLSLTPYVLQLRGGKGVWDGSESGSEFISFTNPVGSISPLASAVGADAPSTQFVRQIGVSAVTFAAGVGSVTPERAMGATRVPQAVVIGNTVGGPMVAQISTTTTALTFYLSTAYDGVLNISWSVEHELIRWYAGGGMLREAAPGITHTTRRQQRVAEKHAGDPKYQERLLTKEQLAERKTE